jgi:hypothetical protein
MSGGLRIKKRKIQREKSKGAMPRGRDLCLSSWRNSKEIEIKKLKIKRDSKYLNNLIRKDSIGE